MLSRAALRLVAEAMLKEKPGCHKRGGPEDVNMGELSFKKETNDCHALTH